MRRQGSWVLAVLAAACLFGVSAGAASAAVICVPNNTPGGCDSTQATINAAVTDAATVDGDTIRIAVGTYNESIDTGKRLRFEGASTPGPTDCFTPPDGSADTTIQGGLLTPGLKLTHGGEVSGLIIAGGFQETGTNAAPGIQLHSTDPGNYTYVLDHVCGIGGSGYNTVSGTPGSGLDVLTGTGATADITITNSRFSPGQMDQLFAPSAATVKGPGSTVDISGSRFLVEDPRPTIPALSVGDGATVTATGSSFIGHYGVAANGSDLTLRRSRVLGNWVGVLSTTDTRNSATTIEDSLIRARGKPGGDPPVGGIGVVASTSAAGTQSILVRGSTISALADVVPTLANAAAVLAFRTSPANGLARVDLRNSVARLVSTVDHPPSDDADLVAAGIANTPGSTGGTITAEASSFNTVKVKGAGSAPAPGSGSNVSGDPGFVDEAARDFRLAPGSRLIDAGSPSFITAGELDLLGVARPLDGNGDCTARPDIGAFEAPKTPTCAVPKPPPATPPANVAPRVSGFSIARKRLKRRKGTKFAFTLSEAAKVAITIERKTTGRRVRGRCRKQTRSNRKARRCTLYARAGVLRASKKAGRGSISFSGRFKGRALALGSYRARLVATDPQGAKSAAKEVSFRVVAR